MLKHMSRKNPAFSFNFSFNFDLPKEKISSSNIKNYKVKLNNPKQDNFEMDLKWCVNTKPCRASFKLIKQEFEKVDMNYLKNEYKCFELDKIDYERERTGDAMRCHHILTFDQDGLDEQAFVVEILHVIAKKWSGLRILKYGELMASSHFIGIAQLPIDNQVGLNYDNGISLEKFEKAMLVRNLNGDYAIVKGKWTGLRARSGRTPGDPGKLSVKYYLMAEKKVKAFQVPKSFVFRVDSGSIQAIVNLKLGTVLLLFNSKLEKNVDPLEIESLLALVFSISTLHVILQPKPRPDAINSIPTSRSNQFTSQGYSPRFRSSPFDNFLLLNMIGYSSLMNSGYYHHHCHDFNGHHGQNDNDSWIFNETEITNSVDDSFYIFFINIKF